MIRMPVTISILKGPITVAYKKENGKWICTALEFDLCGVGDTREEAFELMRGCVNLYLKEIMDTEGRVQFFNPSEREEWAVPDKELWRVVVALKDEKKTAPYEIENLDELRKKFRNRFCSSNLIPISK